MIVEQSNWFQLERWLETDDRAVVPLGSTEQHAYLSLATDTILAERVAREAADPLGIPVFPAVPYGISPYFLAYPGTVSLGVGTYVRVIADILDSLSTTGLRRIVLVSGHGGNAPAASVAREWSARHPGVQAKYHSWWDAPRTLKRIRELEPVARHASWNENFPWTRLEGLTAPSGVKPEIDYPRLRVMDAARVREHLGDGSFGGSYERSDEEMLAVWEIAVAETREALEDGWL